MAISLGQSIIDQSGSFNLGTSNIRTIYQGDTIVYSKNRPEWTFISASFVSNGINTTAFTSSVYYYIAFSSPGTGSITFDITGSPEVNTVDYLIVGGGGGCGNDDGSPGGAGGGGGQVKFGKFTPAQGITYNWKVATPGDSPNSVGDGTAGGESTIFNITASGGSGGSGFGGAGGGNADYTSSFTGGSSGVQASTGINGADGFYSPIFSPFNIGNSGSYFAGGGAGYGGTNGRGAVLDPVEGALTKPFGGGAGPGVIGFTPNDPQCGIVFLRWQIKDLPQ